MGSRDAGFEVIDAGVDLPQKYPRALGRQPLNTVSDVQAEMARIYRAVAGGKISTKQGTSMVFILKELARVIEIAKIEPQIEALMQARRQQLGRSL